MPISTPVRSAPAMRAALRTANDPNAPRTTRRSTRRTALPSGRAALGALLVTGSAVAAFALYSASNGGPTGRFLVATHDLAASAAVRASDFRVARIDLPADLGSLVLQPGNLREVDGDIVTLGPIRAGELIQRGNLIRKPAGVEVREISLSVDPSEAAGGRLVGGDTVDVIATYGSGVDAFTTVVATDIRVVRVERTDGSITSNRGELILTLGVEDPEGEVAIAHASAVGKLAIVRSTGTRGGASSTRRYQPSASTNTTGGAAT